MKENEQEGYIKAPSRLVNLSSIAPSNVVLYSKNSNSLDRVASLSLNEVYNPVVSGNKKAQVRLKNFHTKKRSREVPDRSLRENSNNGDKRNEKSESYANTDHNYSSKVAVDNDTMSIAATLKMKEGSLNRVFPQSPNMKKSRSTCHLSFQSKNQQSLERENMKAPSPCSQLKADALDNLAPTSTLQTPRAPIAPSLYEYMKEGGTSKFIPRPEWCRTPENSHLHGADDEDIHYNAKISTVDGTDNRDSFVEGEEVNRSSVQTVAPPPRWGNQSAPENGLLTDQSWGGVPPTHNPSAITPVPMSGNYFLNPPLYLQDPSQQNHSTHEATAVAFIQQTINGWQHNVVVDVAATATVAANTSNYDEESDGISYAQGFNVMSNSEDDASFMSQKQQQRSLYCITPEDTARLNISKPPRGALFGKEFNTALHVCIQNNATEAAAELIRLGSPVNFKNVKGVTPIIAAAQKGNLELVQLLLKHGANPFAVTYTGSTALIQASHFGHHLVVECLLKRGVMAEQANYKNTTALMRAAQEGHEENVKLLLRFDSKVNRENHENLTALMLAAQRGHHSITKILIRHGAKIDTKTPQGSTSLMLACKRGHTEVAKVLISAGSELSLRDSRERTARETATRKGLVDLVPFMTPQAQISMMKYDVMIERRHLMLMMWKLLQLERASVKVLTEHNESKRKHCVYKSVHELSVDFSKSQAKYMNESKKALVQTMMLPMPLVGVIASYMPPPQIWEKRIEMLTRKCYVDADSTISCVLDLIDEILEDGGFLEACDLSGIIAPSNFESWVEWKTWRRQYNRYQRNQNAKARNLALNEVPNEDKKTNSIIKIVTNSKDQQKIHNLKMFICQESTATKLRRDACFSQLLAHRSPLLTRTLESPPYKIPHVIIQKLKNNNDIFSIVRRLGSRGVHFEVNVATEMVLLANELLLWYHSSSG